MAKFPDVLIVGGGVIGLTAAYYLARKGVQVEVLDKADFGKEASWAGAGILVPGNPREDAHPLDQLHAESVAAFSGLSQELRERTGIDNRFLRSGGLEFQLDNSANAESEWRREGIECAAVTGADLRRLEPELAGDSDHAVRLPALAQLRNPRHLQALIVACRGLGANLQSGNAVLGLHKVGNRVVSVATTTGARQAGQFLLAAGAWTDSLMEQVGRRPGIRPIRGQIALLRTYRPLFRHILLLGARYIVPRDDGHVLLGSTTEDVGFNKQTTATAISELLEFGARMAPALADAHVERCWAGLRPAGSDGLPILGRVPPYENLFVAAGHYRSGIQLSPGTAQVMTELLIGETPSVPLAAFSMDRF